MSNISCPYCGEDVEPPLKFCQACKRAITADDLRRSSLKISQKGRSPESTSHAGLSRKDFTFHRKTRTVMLTISAALAIFICYYMAMKFVLHEHMPGNLDVKIEEFVRGKQAASDEIPATQATQSKK